jgi:hypothetical protein
MRLSERLNIVSVAIATGATFFVTGVAFFVICSLFGTCSARADGYGPTGKDLNGIWEEKVLPEFMSLPDLATCEQFLSWSEDQQETYMKDYFREKYSGASMGFSRCLDRYADEASYYVVHECKLNKDGVAEIILETDRIIKIFCYERGQRRENPWRTGRP